MTTEKYYTYIYLDPRKSGDFIYQRGIEEVYCFNHEPFYIGKGLGDRLFWHLNCYKSDGNRHKKNIIKKIRRNGLEPIIIKVLQNATEDEAFTEEITLISIIGRVDKGLGTLTNKTNGGDGGGREREDLSGQKFNRLTALYISPESKYRRVKWFCKCDCGNDTTVQAANLKGGHVKSCGCLCRERLVETKTTHGKSDHHLYNIWLNMKRKCYDSNHKDFKNHGGKNIKVCDRWLDSFENFFNDVGERPTKDHVIYRIDRHDDFNPSNCRWVTKIKQNNYRENTVYLIVDGVTKSRSEWVRISNVNLGTLRKRIKLGWSHKEAVFGK